MTTDDAQNPAAIAGTPSALFTTEPMVTRALAAEIRHQPVLFTKLLEERLGYSPGGLGTFLDVACEKSEDAHTDVRVLFRSGAEIRRIAIEGKLDHFVGAEQVDKQNDANFTHVVLVVLSIEDVPDFVDTDRNPVIVWDEAIACFPDSRLTLVDIGSVDDAKARARRLLRTADLSQLPSDWDVVRRENGNGDPCIVIESTPLPDGRIIRGQIQARRKDSTRPGLRFEYHIGRQHRQKRRRLPAPVLPGAVLDRASADLEEYGRRADRRPENHNRLGQRVAEIAGGTLQI